MVELRHGQDRYSERRQLVAFYDVYLGEASPLDRKIFLTTTHWVWGEAIPRVFTIVGVAEGERIRGLAVPPEPAFYVPYRQTPQHKMSLLLPARVDAASLLPAVTRLVHSIDPAQPVAASTTIRSLVSEELARPRLNALLAAGFGFPALAPGLHPPDRQPAVRIGPGTRPSRHRLRSRPLLARHPSERMRCICGCARSRRTSPRRLASRSGPDSWTRAAVQWRLGHRPAHSARTTYPRSSKADVAPFPRVTARSLDRPSVPAHPRA